MSKPILIEKMKSFSLVVLFISTVLLLYFFWGNNTIDELRPDTEPVNAPANMEDLKTDLIRPERILVNLGAENYTLVPSQETSVWNSGKGNSIIDGLKRLDKAENILVKEISYSQYQEVMNLRSLRAEFAYDIPMSDFCSNFGIESQPGYDSIKYVSAVGYSSSVTDSIFVYDRKDGVYYRLMIEGDQIGLKSLIDSIESKQYSPYYPISIYLGVNNNTLIPVSMTDNLKSFHYQQDFYAHQSGQINILAEKFFGENFDFVRKITEDTGKIIYMYGYGQKVLIVNTDGSIEYKEELLNNASDQSFLESLKTAVNFVDSHGSWDSLEGAKVTPYLKNVIESPEKNEGYRFIFGLEVNGSPLFYEQGNAFVVDVVNGQVNYFKRNMIDFDTDEVQAIKTAPYRDVFSAGNLIAKNYEHIYKILVKQGILNSAAGDQNHFEDVSALINNMQTGYMRPVSQKTDDMVKPVWVVTIRNINFYFDLYNAEPLSYSVE